MTSRRRGWPRQERDWLRAEQWGAFTCPLSAVAGRDALGDSTKHGEYWVLYAVLRRVSVMWQSQWNGRPCCHGYSWHCQRSCCAHDNAQHCVHSTLAATADVYTVHECASGTLPATPRDTQQSFDIVAVYISEVLLVPGLPLYSEYHRCSVAASMVP